MIYKAEKKKRSRRGKASLGWFLGRGYVCELMSIKFECWCVTKNGAWICDAKSRLAAIDIAEAMNKSNPQ